MGFSHHSSCFFKTKNPPISPLPSPSQILLTPLQVSTDTSSLRRADPKGRSALLADIQQGTRLRKVTQINDRSAPQIEKKAVYSAAHLPPTWGGFLLLYCGSVSLPGGKTGQGPGSRAPSPRLPNKTISGPLIPPASPRLGNTSEAHGAARTGPASPQRCLPPPPPTPTPRHHPYQGTSPVVCTPCALCGHHLHLRHLPQRHPRCPRPRFIVQGLPAPSRHPAPTPSPLRVFPGSQAEGLRPATPAAPVPTVMLRAPRGLFARAPLPGANNTHFQAPPQKVSAQALPAPPAPPGSQTFLQKKRHGRPGAGGGKLNPPPAPPARSPTTELSSKSQQATAWTPMQQSGGQLRNGSLHIIDDFESKFTFHSVEDFPPPDEYKPCQKIYPSKIPRSRTPGPWLQAEAVGQSSDDIKGRNSQVTQDSCL
uniref:WAS/WASL interacting protein family member 3 n=1 Tax=Rhinopithecus bieti TaxID=61621 RepID=A0A2K6L7V3_RHIBE